MLQEAKVGQIVDNMAIVYVERKSACGHDCSQCGGGCNLLTVTSDTKISVKNDAHAKVGDEVLIESASSHFLVSAMIVYLLPFILFFVAYFLGGSYLGYEREAVLISIGFGGFSLGILVAILWDRREKKRQNLKYKMVGITKECLDI